MKKILKDYTEFYKKNLKKKHIICTIISMIIFVTFLVSNIIDLSIIEQINYTKEAYSQVFKENILLSFIIIFAGITPYFFLSIVGFTAMYNISTKVALMYLSSNSIINLIIYCFLAVIISIAYSLCISTGIHYCILSSKKFTYSQKKGFKFNDFKKAIYALRKNEKKVEELEQKNKIQLEEAEKLNVKIPYSKYTISLIITIIILAFTSLVIR